MLRITQIQRRPTAAQFSVEGYFQRVRDQLLRLDPNLLQLQVLSRHSSGLKNRLLNLLFTARFRGQVCHVTGDVHYVTCVLRRHQTVLTVLDCEILHRLQGWRRWLVKLFWFTLPVRFAARITVISHETKRQLLQQVRYPADRIHVIPVSVSPLFVPAAAVPFPARPRILQVGTKANKNVPRLLQALQGLDVHLDLVGPVSDELRQQIEDSGVPWTSWGRLTDEQLVERYHAADIIAFVSTHEGFGMPIVEAQCVERVCVTSNCSSMPEVAGDGACLVDPFDVQSIRAGFVKVIEDAAYREQLIARGRVNRTRFELSTIAEQFLEVYRQVAAEATDNRRGQF
jgi:glycosyltransferase involved in cell wall biosynthesis